MRTVGWVVVQYVSTDHWQGKFYLMLDKEFDRYFWTMDRDFAHVFVDPHTAKKAMGSLEDLESLVAVMRITKRKKRHVTAEEFQQDFLSSKPVQWNGERWVYE